MKRWKAIKNIIRPFQLEEIQVAFITFFIMLIPVLAFLIILEVYIPKSILLLSIDEPFQQQTPNIKTYLLYLISAVSHLILSFVVILFFWSKLMGNCSLLKVRVFRMTFYFLTITLTGIYLFSDTINTNLALLSHDRLYNILNNNIFFKPFFIEFPGDYFADFKWIYSFHVFSVIPFSLIALGLVIIVLTCLNIGKDVRQVIREIEIKPDKQRRQDIIQKVESFHNYIYILSAILVTSTIATIIFFQLPIPCIADPKEAMEFSKVSLSMGICWGVIFSLTMLVMCFYPYVHMRKEIKKYQTESFVIEDVEYKDWLNKMSNTYLAFNNVKSFLSILTPIIISMIPKLF